MKKQSDKEVDDTKPQPPLKPATPNPNSETARRPKKAHGIKGWLLRCVNRLIAKLSKFN